MRRPDLEREAVADPDDPYVKFESRISIGDVADLVFRRATHSPGAQGIAGFLVTLGLLGAVDGMSAVLWVPLLFASLAIATGFVLLPFIWWSYVGAPELIHETIEADISGMLRHIGDHEIRQPWSVYRTAEETDRLFILTSSVVRPLMLTKRGLHAADAARFRMILAQVDLLRPMDVGGRSFTLAGFAIGAAVAVATLLVTGGIRL